MRSSGDGAWAEEAVGVLEVQEVAPGLLQVVGSVDLTTAAVLREKLGKAVERAVADQMPVVSVDLHAVEFVDAAGLGVLLGAHRRALRGGSSLRLVRLSKEISRAMLVSRLYRVLDIEHTSSPTETPGAAVPSPRRDPAGQRPLASS